MTGPAPLWISVSRAVRSGDSYQQTSADWSAIWCAPPRNHGHVLPRRWVVELTFAWLGRNRRLSTDDEALPGTEEAWIYLAMIRLLLARLTLRGLFRHPLGPLALKMTGGPNWSRPRRCFLAD